MGKLNEERESMNAYVVFADASHAKGALVHNGEQKSPGTPVTWIACSSASQPPGPLGSP